MDTVYERGMLAQQPFRIDGDRAYGLGMADDKHGIALILHALAMLKALGVASYHAGNAPDQGRNALYELSHQLLQLRIL